MKLKGFPEMKVIFLGDSLTEGTVGASFFNILQKQLPDENLINFGRNGDSTYSLYERMKFLKYQEIFDIAFLWIGTNDIFFNLNYSKYQDDFKENYKKILDRLVGKAEKIITVSPIYLGGESDLQWHNEQKKLSEIIRMLSEIYSDVEYFDIQEIFISLLENNEISKKKDSKTLNDLFLKFSNDITDKSIPKMLIFTIDGVHLNDLGAEVVADVFLGIIKKQKI